MKKRGFLLNEVHCKQVFWEIYCRKVGGIYYGKNYDSRKPESFSTTFSIALAGDDVDKMKEMQAAVEKGFKQATGAWDENCRVSVKIPLMQPISYLMIIMLQKRSKQKFNSFAREDYRYTNEIIPNKRGE